MRRETEYDFGRLPVEVEKVISQIKPPIQIKDVPNAKDWVFLNGYMYPDPKHRAFDFSAYETRDGKIKLGIPSTIIRAPFSGTVLRANDGFHGGASFWGEPGYAGDIEIMGQLDNCIVTAVLGHVTPNIAPGKVREGEIIGQTFESPQTDKGTLGHLHFELDIAYKRSRYMIDPVEYLLKGSALKRIELPHSGPFKSQELRNLGFETKYTDELNYHITPTPVTNLRLIAITPHE